MSGMRIDASSTSLGRLVAAGATSGGSPAQQAYDRAVKRLAEAQARLARDVADREPDETIEVDKAMVELAAAQVAQAAAALARERAGESSSAPSGQPAAASTPAPARQWDLHVQVDA